LNTNLKRVLAGLVATAIVGVTPLLSTSLASAATLAGPATVKTAGGAADLSSGDANDAWTLRLPAGAACAADGNNGGRWHTYMIPGSQDPAVDLAFAGNGALVGASTGSAGTGTFRNNLYSTTSNPVRGNPPNLGDAAVINIPNMNFNVWTAGQIPSGVYNIGIACVDLDLGSAIDSFWNQQITVSYPGGDAAGAQISWAVGAAPAAPVITTVTAGDQTLTAAFTHASSSPASTYTATATPSALDPDCATSTPETTAPTATVAPIVVSALDNGCEYDVTVAADNGVGGPVASAPVAGTPSVVFPAPVVMGTPGAPGSGTVDLSWTASGSPTGYTAEVEGGAGTLDYTSPATTASVSGLADQCYDFTVTALYASGQSAPPGVVQVCLLPEAVLMQHISVEVPVGQLVITQVCGTNGDIPEAPADPAYGFDVLPAVPADLVGTAPTTDWPGATTPDPQFGEYPYPTPPTYPTHCGVELGTAEFIQDGPLAGQFYRADGLLNQVTVVDLRDTDTGWVVTGTMGDFQAGTAGTDPSFGGDQLGWAPAKTDTAAYAYPGGTYDQVVAPGAEIKPNTGGGLGDGATFGSAAGGAGRGIATLDARIKLLIPVNAFAGDYEGTLTIDVVGLP
jgi:hypothetical protein